MSVILYMTSTTTNRDIYTKQNRIKLVLDGKGIKYEEVDLCKDQEKRDEMREKAGIPDLLPPQLFNGDTYCGVRICRGTGIPDLLPPQLFNGDTYCGNFESFDDALEEGRLQEFLLLK